jgi:hypothetical protein
LQAVKTRGVVQHGGITALLHVQQNVGDALFNAGIGFSGPMQARLEFSIKCAASG